MVIAVVAPIVEELTYRGLGFRLLARFGRGAAITLTAMVFAASHGHVAVLPTSFAFGLGLGYLRSHTSSVYPGMAVHVLINAMGVSAIALGPSAATGRDRRCPGSVHPRTRQPTR